MSQASSYYRHSGAIGAAGIPLMVLLGLVAALVGGAVYGYLSVYIPIIYLNFFLTIGFGGLVGYLVGTGAKLGKVRNNLVTGSAAFFAGVLGDFFGWSFWFFAATEQEYLPLHPAALWAAIGAVAENGAWTIFGSTPKGTLLYVIWLAELILIVGTAILTALGRVSLPFCESCQKWTDLLPGAPTMQAVADPAALKARLEEGDFAALEELGKAEPDAAAYTELEIKSCPDCDASRYLTIRSVEIVKSSKGEEKVESNLLEDFALSPDAQSKLASPA